MPTSLHLCQIRNHFFFFFKRGLSWREFHSFVSSFRSPTSIPTSSSYKWENGKCLLFGIGSVTHETTMGRTVRGYNTLTVFLCPSLGETVQLHGLVLWIQMKPLFRSPPHLVDLRLICRRLICDCSAPLVQQPLRGPGLTRLPAWRYNCVGEALKGQPQATGAFEADGPWLGLKRPVALHVYDLTSESNLAGWLNSSKVNENKWLQAPTSRCIAFGIRIQSIQRKFCTFFFFFPMKNLKSQNEIGKCTNKM